MEKVRREVVLPHPPEAVWPAVTTPEELSQWFGADVQIDLRPGGRADFRFPDGTRRSATVEEVEPPRRLAFRWSPFERTPEGTRPALQSRVEIELEAVPEGTRLLITENALARVTEHATVDTGHARMLAAV